MQKIEKVTASKSLQGEKISLNTQIKLDNGLVVQTSLPVQGASAERDATKAIEIVNDIVAPILEGLNPLRQKELDKMITELSAVHNLHNVNISLTLSCCILKAAAAIHGESQYAYIRRIYDGTRRNAVPPTVVYTIIKNNGQTGDFKEFTLIPSRNKSVSEAFSLFRLIEEGVKLHTPELTKDGLAIMNTVQLEILTNAINKAKLSIHHDLFIGIKPEIKHDGQTGFICNDMLEKASDMQMVEYFKEIQVLYAPLINENSLMLDDLIKYMSLHQEIGEKTIITISSDIITTPYQCKKYAAALPASMLSLHYASVSSVSHCIDLINAALESEWKFMIDATNATDTSSLHALAFGLHADFIKIDSCTSEAEKELYDVGQAD